MLANEITREKEKVIKKQDVEAQEAILEPGEAAGRGGREAEAGDRGDRAARQHAQAAQVQEEERLKSERVRIATDEEVAVAEGE
ncbi:MAG: hypothetical protein R3B90_02490 [Planctomycetaceae bacterium]